MKKFTLCTAIAYTSGKPHIGNTYEIILADAICRFKRLTGYDVYFQTGTDEHGQKVQQNAEKLGVTPQAFVDDVAGEIKRIWDLMNTTYDRFVRTTDPLHEKTVQKIFKKLYEQGDIYKSEYEGLYCTPCESFFTDSQADGGNCPDCGRPLKAAKEEAYFFRLSKYGKQLLDHIEAHPEFIQPEPRKKEMLNNFILPGLQDLCVSRTSFNWGVPVDFDDGHVIYVWIDALSNYITFLGYDPYGESAPEYKKYWPCDVHLIGKDILRFHTIYWPCMLLALGEPLPKQVFGHPWLMVGEGKMSKSKGNVLYADDLVRHFSVDAVRYFTLHEMPFAADGTITYELMIERINSDLANILGNLLNRTVSMTHQYFGGIIPTPAEEEPLDRELKELALLAPVRVQEKMDELRVADAIDEVFTLLRRANKYVDETTPWVLGRSDESRGRLGTVLYNLLESLRISAILLSSFLPETAEKMLSQLGRPASTFESLSSFGGMTAGATLEKPEILFARLDAAKKLKEIEADLGAPKEAKAEPKKAEAPSSPESAAEITIDDFMKVDLRTAKVVACEKVPKADKLLRLEVEIGGEVRQVVSGIAKWYAPEDLIGRKIIVVKNLKAAKLRGLESRGMILCADVPGEEDEARVIFVDDDLSTDAKVR